jgi:hypothetical protein
VVVGPLRALLVAQAEATKNRWIRQVSRSGMLATAIFLGLALGTIVVPLLIIGATGGYYGGTDLRSATTRAVLGGLMNIPWIAGGASGAMWGSRALPWENQRAFPLRSRTLFAAELCAGLADPFIVLIVLFALATVGGLAIARPFLTPLLLLVFCESVLALLVIQQLVATLAAAILRRVQAGLLIFVTLLFAGAIYARRLGFGLSSGPMRGLSAYLNEARRLAAWLPGGAAIQGVWEAGAGQYAAALLRQLVVLAWLFTLTRVTIRALEREASGNAALTSSDFARGGTWSFRRPTIGMAKLHWDSLLESRIGRFGLLSPLMAMVLVEGPFNREGSGTWLLAGAVIYLHLANEFATLNQFGLDGHGIKSLFFLPISSRQVLAGKTIALMAYQTVQFVLTLGLFALAKSPSLPLLASAFCVALSSGLFLSCVGHFVSVWQPFRIERRRRGPGGPTPWMLTGIALVALVSVVFALPFVVCATLAPGWLVPMGAASLLVMAATYALALPWAAAYLDAGHERLIDALA